MADFLLMRSFSYGRSCIPLVERNVARNENSMAVAGKKMIAQGPMMNANMVATGMPANSPIRSPQKARRLISMVATSVVRSAPAPLPIISVRVYTLGMFMLMSATLSDQVQESA